MRTPSPSEIAAARIPKITDLRDQLCYGDARLARCTAFVDDLRVFRRRYSFLGLRGTELWDWKSSEHQAALRQMTASFLDEHGYGELYWPSDPAALNFNSLQYSKDRTFITRTMRQLIFRLNLQQYRNTKYKKKEHQLEPETHEIVDSEDEESLPKPHAVFPTKSTHSNVFANYAYVPSTITSQNSTDPDLLHPEIDVYGTSTTSDYEPEPRATKRKLSDPRKPKPLKRSRIVSSNVPAGRDSIPDPRRAVPEAKWTSPRERRTVQRPNYGDIHGLDRAIASQTMTAQTTSDHEGDMEAGRRTNIRQSSENIEDVLNYIRTNRPSRTSASFSPTPVIGQTKPTHDSHIDPNLERIIPPSSDIYQPKPSHSSSTSSTIINPRKKVQAERHPSPSPAPTVSTLEPPREPILQTSASPMPLPITQGAQTLLNQGMKSSATTSAMPAAASSASPKTGIDFNYIVILSRTPVYQYKTWRPKGHFLEKSLSELVVELPFENKMDIIGLTIRLEGPGIAVEETLDCDEDAKFDTTKSRFLRMVKMCHKSHTKANPGKLLIMNFEIEAVREGGVEEEDDDDDDIVF